MKIFHFALPLTSSTLKELIKIRKTSTAKLKLQLFREKAFLPNIIYLNLHQLLEFLLPIVKKMLLFTLFQIQYKKKCISI